MSGMFAARSEISTGLALEDGFARWARGAAAKKRMIVITNKGWLGNALFVFANFIACAEENKLTVANPALDEYAEFFQTTSEDFFCRYPARKSFYKGNRRTRRLLNRASYLLTRALVRSRINCRRLRAVTLDHGEELRLDSPEFVASLCRGQLIFAQGWLFRERSHFSRHGDAIRRYFTPLKAYRDNVDELIEKARQDCDVLVGVYIRHGDFKTFMGGKYFYEIEEYTRVMEKVSQLFPGKRVRFLVCTNVEANKSAFAQHQVTFGRGHIIEDLYSFARCDYIVGPPSTYTMWASFYGNVPLYVIEDSTRSPALADFNPVQ